MNTITNEQLFSFTQFVGDVIAKESTKGALIDHTVCYFGVCPKDAAELITRCEELEYIEKTENGYRITTV
jgi:hypothetical protein